jgi:hypothetical protein
MIRTLALLEWLLWLPAAWLAASITETADLGDSSHVVSLTLD